MFFLYKIITTIFFLLSPILILFRLLIGKEDYKRILEKYSLKKNINKNTTIWFHGASVGEIMSILPIINKFEKDKDIKSILLTSSTTSSASIIKKKSFKKTKHVYYPFDVNFLCKNFLNNWKPRVAIFVDSEVWPNMLNNLSSRKIPTILINARITNKSFKRWSKFYLFAKFVFSKITIALPQNEETKVYLKKLGVKKIKFLGNLKYFGKNDQKQSPQLKNYFRNKLIFTAVSTHYNEEKIIGKLHINLKKKLKNIITIIIPRHVNRTNDIIEELNRLNLKVIKRSDGKKPKSDFDIFLVDTYGEMTKFLRFSRLTFIGGSLVNHGGQNPLEAARIGNYIIHGKQIGNFKEVYQELKKLKISKEVKHIHEMQKVFMKNHQLKRSQKAIKRIDFIGNKILKDNIQEIKSYL
tara:strand:- start:7 stop:1236 length:1230 start_codon:yes stop_codon:yes gene_type:complete